MTQPKEAASITLPLCIRNTKAMLNFMVYTLTLSTAFFPISSSSSEPTTIYQLLRSNGLPMGLLPKGITNFTYSTSGRFDVRLDQPCNAKFEDQLHYDLSVSGNLTYGQIEGLSGISAQDLFLWFPVQEIRVDIPSSGLIYFDVGVVSKQFSLSSFETPRDCFADSNNVIVETVRKKKKNLSRKLGTRKTDHQQHRTTFLET